MATPPQQPAPANTKHILLVDDDLMLCDMYAERLKAAGYNVTTAHDGEAAIKAIEASLPDLVLLDIMIPKINGLDVLKQLKANPKFADLKIIFLTALVQEVDKVKGLAGGNVDYYLKSQTVPKDLISRIDQYFAKLGTTPSA